jgi:F-box and leucine-rich repeat protein GRR1
MLVSKSWCVAAYPLIWQRPSLASVSQFAGFVRALGTPNPLLPYPTTVRRLVFNSFARHLPDDLFSGITVCQHLERLTLPGATHLSTATLLEVLGQLPELVSIDLSGMEAVDDKVVMKVASKCPQLQGLNLSKCKRVGDEGIVAVAHQLSALRRVSGRHLADVDQQIKLSGCHRLTDRAIVALTRHCPHLLELDLAGVPQLTNDATISIFLNAKVLRELKMNDNKTVSAGAIPDLEELSRVEDSSLFDNLGAYPWHLVDVPSPKACSRLSPRPPSMDPALVRPITVSFDQLRIVDLTSCTALTDQDVDHLVHNAPQLRTLTLAKCTNLTDFAVESISRLGKFLHYLHLGHVRK